jgi:CRISPR-associated endonuclease Cas2
MNEKLYIVAYDIANEKRLTKVRKLIYSYALGGQKSSLEVPLRKKDLKELIDQINPLIKKGDKVNIIQVNKEPLLFGKANFINYDKGVIIV